MKKLFALTTVMWWIALVSFAQAQAALPEWYEYQQNAPIVVEEVLVVEGQNGLPNSDATSRNEYFSQDGSSDRTESVRNRIRAYERLRADGRLSFDPSEVAPLFETGVATTNARRMIDSKVEPFVVGFGAERTNRFRDVAMLIGMREEFLPNDKNLTDQLQRPPTLDPNSAICSGVFVSDQTILTAAHCICQLGLGTASVRGRYALMWGSDLKNFQKNIRINEPVGVLPISLNLTPITMDPNFCQVFNASEQINGPDVALVYLNRSAVTELHSNPSFSRWRSFRPAIFAWPELYFSNLNGFATVVGYGKTDVAPDDEDEQINVAAKVAANIPIVDMICENPISMSQFGCRPGEEMVLIDQIFGNDTCQGDSGGPVYLRYYSRFFLVGITSRAALKIGGCGTGGIYTLLTPRILAWVRKNTLYVDPTF